MDVLADLEARGLVQDSTDREALAKRLAEGPITLYHGIDPTADSLHTGHLLGMLVLRRFQMAGHFPVALAGGATGMVGDPSGRSEERVLLDEDTLRHNVQRISAQLQGLLEFSGQTPAVLVDNYTWTRDMPLLAFLRDVGKHFTLNAMVAKESVRARMESERGISFTEFSYMLLQAHDYLWLHEHHGCELQVGGSDQWGNITAGIDLIRRRAGRAVHGLTWPLLLSEEGAKIGMTTGARVWLDPARTSPYQFHQHWIQTGDDGVERLLLQFTFMDIGEIADVMERHRAAPERREAQRLLAREVTAIVHGAEAAVAAEQAAAVLFGAEASAAAASAFEAIAGEVPTTGLGRDQLTGGLDLADVLVQAGLVSSRSDARRQIDQGGVYVNNRRVGEGRSDGPLAGEDLLHSRFILLRRGKRDYHLLFFE